MSEITKINMERIQKFKYTKADGTTSKREVFVVHDSPSKIAGFDFTKLTDAEQSMVKIAFEKKPITPFPVGKTSVNYEALGVSKDIFQRSYRTFLKARFSI